LIKILIERSQTLLLLIEKMRNENMKNNKQQPAFEILYKNVNSQGSKQSERAGKDIAKFGVEETKQ
jgi:hypothetical protein